MEAKAVIPPQFLQVAISYFQSGNIPAAEEICRKVLHSHPKNVDFIHLLGIILSQSGRYEEAVKLFERAIHIKKDDPLLNFTLALILQQWGKLNKALLRYRKAVALKPDYIEAIINIGDILKEQNQFNEAEQEYRRAIKIKSDSAAAYNNLGTVLCHQEKLSEAEDMFRRAVSIKPDFAAAYYNLGTVLDKQGKIDEVAEAYAKAVNLKSPLALMNANLGRVFQNKLMLNEALSLYEHNFRQQPDNQSLLSEIVRLNYNACAWERISYYDTRLLEMIREGREGISLYSALCTPATAEDLLICARSFNRNIEYPPQNVFMHHVNKSGRRIKIGYLSSDFYEHATSRLMAELFEGHDRSRFSISAYSYGADRKDSMRERLIKAFDDFINVNHLSDREAAQKIYDDGIDILIDLKGGFTPGSRIGIAAHRPAPVQANYLGYPGTMGVDFIDYIIADRFVIPENLEKFYSEKVICLPDSYQPNDTHRKIAQTTPTRESCGLPEQGFVFCCFNANYKITPQIFDIWMRLLHNVPQSVLWLYLDNNSVRGNLRREIERRGINPERVIFARDVPLPEHLARHRLADLFLDTLPVNAHTTASDALWAGLPVLTCAGETFASRVAGSLLTAAGLTELITYSLPDYEALALQLAQNPARLSDIRQKLERTRLQTPLFDIERFTRNIEKSYQAMWDIWQAGQSPKAFTIS